MKPYLSKEKALSNMARFLSLLYEDTVFQGPIPLDEAIALAAKKMDLSRFEILALYYKAKRRSLIQVECLKDSYSSLKVYVSITSKGVQALIEVIH
jgi:hypothetical protein